MLSSSPPGLAPSNRIVGNAEASYATSRKEVE
jgi:hypothetical protein